jgi:hypothetical protein
MECTAVELTPTGNQLILDRFQQTVQVSEPTSTVQVHIPKTKPASRRSGRINFGVATDPRLRLKRPIRLVISRKKGVVIAISEDLKEFGTGLTMSDALDDFSKGLARLFFRLSDDSTRLGPDLIRLKEKVDRYLEVRPR